MLKPIKKLSEAPFVLQMSIGNVAAINVWRRFFNEEYSLLNKYDPNRDANAVRRANLRFFNTYEKVDGKWSRI